MTGEVVAGEVVVGKEDEDGRVWVSGLAVSRTLVAVASGKPDRSWPQGRAMVQVVGVLRW